MIEARNEWGVFLYIYVYRGCSDYLIIPTREYSNLWKRVSTLVKGVSISDDGSKIIGVRFAGSSSGNLSRSLVEVVRSNGNHGSRHCEYVQGLEREVRELRSKFDLFVEEF